MIHRERDQFEAELKDLTRRFETLDLGHAALTRERNTLSKEVAQNFLVAKIFLVLASLTRLHLKVFSSRPPGGDLAAVGDSPAEGQGLPPTADSGVDCPL